MEPDIWGPEAAVATAGALGSRNEEATGAESAVTVLYHEHALGLVRLAYVMLGDRASAEDVVQEAFCGLYRRWESLADTGNALRYLRSSVLNGSRSVLRRRAVRRNRPSHLPPAASAEAAMLSGEERRGVMLAVRRLPPRQREALVLRFYLDLSEEEIAALMGIGSSTVRSATHRALASLARMLREDS